MNQPEIHPLALLYPPMSGVDYARLRESIRANGLQRRITMFEGKILDGVHRQRACQETGTTPLYEQLPSNIDPVAFVIAHNSARRHLTASQLAMVASKFAGMESEKAAARKTNNLPSQTGHVTGLGEQGETSVILGKKFGVGEVTVRKAIQVRERGEPELVTAVESGRITVNEGARLAKMKPAKQREIVSITDPIARRKKAETSALRTAGRLSRTPPVELRGTELTRQILGRLEGLGNDLARVGLHSASLIADRFNQEFGWKDDFQLRQLESAREVITAIYIIHRRANEVRAWLKANSK